MNNYKYFFVISLAVSIFVFFISIKPFFKYKKPVNPDVKLDSYCKKLTSPTQRILFIQQVFLLSSLELSEVLNIEHNTLLHWLQGGEPNSNNHKRINNIFKIAVLLENMNIERPYRLIRAPIFEGKSFLEVMMAGEDTLLEESKNKLFSYNARLISHDHNHNPYNAMKGMRNERL